jgi:hypothetical protein
MKKFYVLMVALSMASGVSAQGCLPEGITFSTQAQIDNFQTNYPNCTEILGDVIIGQSDGSDITNLNGLYVLISIGGNLWIGADEDIGNPSLTSLTGLGNLTSIGDNLYISDNDALTSLTGLDNLTSIGYLFICCNSALTSLTGLGNLTSTGGNLYISDNDALTSLTGLENITSIGGDLYIGYNDALNNLTGLENLTSIGGDLWIDDNNSLSICDAEWLCNYISNPSGSIVIYYNANGCNSVIELANACGGSVPCLPYGNYYFFSQADIDYFQTAFSNCTALQGIVGISGSDITNLSGLNNVTSIGSDCFIYNFNALTSLTGLDNLTSIGGLLDIYNNNALTSLTGLNNVTSIGGILTINRNAALTSLTELENLTYIGGNLEIWRNEVLTSLTGLDNVVANSINDLYISGNNSLSTCAIQSICDYLAAPNGTVYIDNNATGCNSPEEVEAACGVGLDESAVSSRQSAVNIYPNPASTTITIEMPTTPDKNTTLAIFNISGQRLIKRRIMEQQTVVDVSGLSQGVYFVSVADERMVMVGKFVKQ